MRFGISLYGFGLALLAVLSGCSGGTKPTNSGQPTATGRTHPERPLYPIEQAKGEIVGKVFVEGVVPEPEKIATGNSDPLCREMHESNPLMTQYFVLGKRTEEFRILVNAGATTPRYELANVLVFISAGLEKYSFEIPSKSVVLDQKECLFEPRVFGAVAGQTLSINNSDKTFHSVMSKGAHQEANKFFFATPKGEAQTQVLGAAEDPFEITCPVHPWMNGFCGVFDHPFFTVTGKDGSFQLKGMLPGEYTLTAWHEKLGTATQTVSVSPEGKEAPIEFVFKIENKQGSK